MHLCNSISWLVIEQSEKIRLFLDISTIYR